VCTHIQRETERLSERERRRKEKRLRRERERERKKERKRERERVCVCVRERETHQPILVIYLIRAPACTTYVIHGNRPLGDQFTRYNFFKLRFCGKLSKIPGVALNTVISEIFSNPRGG
jgi:hypothetical protein